MEETLKKLISFKTVSADKAENKKALKWVKSQINGLPVKELSYDGHPTLVIGSMKPKLCLQAHLDVVPAKEALFNPKVEGGKLIGRGAYDMKFAIACYLELLETIKKRDVGILITADEELGGFNGVGAALKDGYEPGYCFLPDGGDDWSFDEKVKGVLHLNVLADGEPGHASRPWEGDSALLKLVNFLKELESHFSSKAYSAETFDSTLNIGKVEGGKATNQIAASAKAQIDIRFPDREEKKKIDNLLKRMERSYSGIELKEIVSGASFHCDLEHKFCKAFATEAQKLGKEVTSQLAHGSSDARFFAQREIPTMMIKPNGGGSHSSKEWVDLDDLNDYCLALKRFIKKVA